MTEPVYKDVKEAILGLVRIFGPCHLSLILGELRSLIRAKAIANIPPTWSLAARSYVKADVLEALDALWMAEQIISTGETQDQQRYRAA